MFNKKILLASKSPRRQELLKNLIIDFDVVSIDCDEHYSEKTNRYDVPVFLSIKKSSAYLNTIPNNSILLTADTIVLCNDAILGKPNSKEEAKDFLRMLSDNVNTVITGVTLKDNSKNISFSVQTEVYFSQLSEQEIDHYLDTYKPYDKAGAYGIQEWIGMIGVREIKGSYYNVVGLPVHEIYQNLKKHF